jgi:TolA-binding protein
MQFSAGSVIYFKGDEASTIFLLKRGRVNLVYQNFESGEDQHDAVTVGEFFGVRSALGRYRREENAAAMLDSVVMIFSTAEFEQLAMSNSRIMMRMLTVFSNELRRVHKKVADLTESAAESPEDGLFHTGEFYLKNRRFSLARHIFGRYLTYYPSGQYAALAGKYLDAAEKLASPSGDASSGGGRAASPAPPDSPAQASSSGGESPGDAAKTYYDALSLMSRKMYQQAYNALKGIINEGTDEEYTIKSYFDMGRCLFSLQRYDDCISFFTQMLIKYPRHPSLAEALYFVGQSHDRSGRPDQAGGFYRKALALAPEGGESLRGKIKQALAAQEG